MFSQLKYYDKKAMEEMKTWFKYDLTPFISPSDYVSYELPPNLEETTAIDFASIFSRPNDSMERRPCFSTSFQVRPEKLVGTKYSSWPVVTFYVFTDGSYYAIADFWYKQPLQERYKFYKGESCKHKYDHKLGGNCYHIYTCLNCGRQYSVDSSD